MGMNMGMNMKMNKELQAVRMSNIPRGLGTAHSAFVDHASGSEIWDVEGQRFIDFATGIAVCNTGHNHPEIIHAVKEQIDQFSHVCFQVNAYEPYIRLAEKLNKAAPGPSPKKSIFLTTGAEAVENAIKIARSHTKRSAIIAFKGGFHGRTMMGMALTGKVAPYKTGFGPFPGEIYHIPYPVAYHNVDIQTSLDALDLLFKADVEPERVAAIILEPVQGEGGFYAAPIEFIRKLRTLCDQHGICLIIDEIQTGFARTGKLFATEYAEIEPDMMTIAKAMAGGFPISGVIGKADIMDAPAVGGLGGTYGGSPLGCVAGLSVLDIIERENLCGRAMEIGNRFKQRLVTLQKDKDVSCIGDVRNLGAMIAIEFIKDQDSAQPDPDITKFIVSESARRGLILLSCGVYGNVIRFLPALTISNKILDEGLDILSDSIFEVIRKHRS